MFGRKKSHASDTYDRENLKPVIRCSICTGEQAACFEDRRTGQLQEVMLIRGPGDLAAFREEYGITEEIERRY